MFVCYDRYNYQSSFPFKPPVLNVAGNTLSTDRPMPRTTVGALEQDFTLSSGSSFSPVGLHASPGRSLLLIPSSALVTTVRYMGSYHSLFVSHDHSTATASSSLERLSDISQQNAQQILQ